MSSQRNDRPAALRSPEVGERGQVFGGVVDHRVRPVVREVDVPAEGHPVDLSHLGCPFGAGDGRGRAHREVVGVGPLEVEGQPRHGVGELAAEAERDCLEVALPAGLERGEHRRVGREVHLAEAIVRQPLRVARDLVRVEVFLAVVRVRHPRPVPGEIRRL